jgi:hypothetical protein
MLNILREIRSFFTPILVLSFLMNLNSQTKTWVLVTKETKEIAKNELTFRKHFGILLESDNYKCN